MSRFSCNNRGILFDYTGELVKGREAIKCERTAESQDGLARAIRPLASKPGALASQPDEMTNLSSIPGAHVVETENGHL